MKSVLISILLFFLLICAIIINSIYISGICRNISNISDNLQSSSDRLSEAQSLKSIWSKNKNLLDWSIRTNELERMNDLIEGLIASINAENEFEIQKYCALISELAEELAKYEKISVTSLC